MHSLPPTIQWTENQETQSMIWHSENASGAPKHTQLADDTLDADTAYRLACEGTALLWRGDFQNAKNLLQAMARRIDKKNSRKSVKTKKTDAAILTLSQAFHLHRQAQAQRARTLGMLIIPVNADFTISLRRAPDVQTACVEAYGKIEHPFAISLRELLGVIGAHEWRKNGVHIAALGGKIHPYYGVFSPVRGEYLELLAKAPLPKTDLAFDIGTGTGVIAAILANRGIKKIVATDQDDRAIACAGDNLQRLGLTSQIELLKTNLFPEGKAGLIVCNPPWLPARPNAAIEYAIYDQDSQMLRGFLKGVATHLEPGGEAWLIMSDFAEHLGLRTTQEFWSWIDAGGLEVIGKMDIKPHHTKAKDREDPLFQARAAEVTSLWRLRSK
jgi:hypothetical protein